MSNGTSSKQSADYDTPVIIIGAGLSGLVAAYELTKANKKVIIVDQEPAENIGGQAHWSLGGLFFVDTPEQRRLGVKDSKELALRDWLNSAQFDNGIEGRGTRSSSTANTTGSGALEADLTVLDEIDKDPSSPDYWGLQWARAFVDFAATEFRDYVKGLGMGLMMHVGWAERGGGLAGGHGNSVPRFHLAWGIGPEVVRIFREPVQAAEKAGLVDFRFRHRVDELIVEGGRVVGVRGKQLAPEPNFVVGSKTNRKEVGDFDIRGRAVVVASGGIGGNPDLIRKIWPTEKMGGPYPNKAVLGVPNHVDGRMLAITKATGARLVNEDRVWFYTEGLQNWDPIWPQHGIRVIPGPSSLWLDATGKRFGTPAFPGCDSIATLKAIIATGYDYSWYILDLATIRKEFSLSGSEQNPDLASKSILKLISERLGGKGTGPVRKFIEHGQDFIQCDTLPELVQEMNALAKKEAGTSAAGKEPPTIDYDDILKTIVDRDMQVDNKYSKDAQVMLIHNARAHWIDSIMRVVKPHRYLDPASLVEGEKPRAMPGMGPLLAVRMSILTRKTLGGIQTNLQGQALQSDGQTPFPGLYAAGEVNGFGGGGSMGFNALEGTFLGGCIFSGRAVGRALAKEEYD
ncbi:putative 3-ketosteroid-delta-1-dehydrogenase [Meira miltonrushii]|uniref:Putative 3-ketosteroid-delta-1-dehydrogenase n=1 Tax=Meira miltonrushii TaxID=1280837 RepID=A0A316VJH4_9BASI|nr:putative 3-ketosteroid-delta-1-dehydrogenase [Meira miltonrushii]PWN37759.1 putative 3-ketosteroid-delta-1-dehydrogenase [Meira miltonrushii]